MLELINECNNNYRYELINIMDNLHDIYVHNCICYTSTNKSCTYSNVWV